MSTVQAVIKTSYTKNPKAAKANVRYITHRIDRDGNRTTRQIFSNYGLISKNDAYRLIDKAQGRNYFYRIILSPQNTKGEARDLAGITRQTMRDLQKILHSKRPIPFVACAHVDHSDTPHVHALAILKTYLSEKQLEKLRHAAERFVIAEGYDSPSTKASRTRDQRISTPQRRSVRLPRGPSRENGLGGDIFVANGFQRLPLRSQSVTYPGKRIFVCPACREPSTLRKVDKYFECKNCGMEIGRPRQFTLSQTLSYQGGGEL